MIYEKKNIVLVSKFFNRRASSLPGRRMFRLYFGYPLPPLPGEIKHIRPRCCKANLAAFAGRGRSVYYDYLMGLWTTLRSGGNRWYTATSGLFSFFFFFFFLLEPPGDGTVISWAGHDGGWMIIIAGGHVRNHHHRLNRYGAVRRGFVRRWGS